VKISEAVEKALKEDKGITRKSLQKYGFEIHPTNSGECCYVVTKNQQPSRCWNPTADDLMADDWELTTKATIL
jgi:hypothetical protein